MIQTTVVKLNETNNSNNSLYFSLKSFAEGTVSVISSGLSNLHANRGMPNFRWKPDYRQITDKADWKLWIQLVLEHRQKELDFCHKLKFSNPNIRPTWCCKHLIFQTLMSWANRIHCLTYLRSMPYGWDNV